jgi:predicted MPP superfamily phosphohydrolase
MRNRNAYASDSWFRTPSDQQEVLSYANGSNWTFPERPIYFLSDLHADPVAFVRSLVEAGLAVVPKPRTKPFELTDAGKEGLFILGGDLLDKGPNNLLLLDYVKHLTEVANVRLLAGNHDVRTIVALKCLGGTDIISKFLLTRLGRRCVPLLEEIYMKYGGEPSKLSEEEIRDILFPGDNWQEEFAEAAKGRMRLKRIEKELKRTPRKVSEFIGTLQQKDISLQLAYTLLQTLQEQLLDGDYVWFTDLLEPVCREGSFVFVHAGLDDIVAGMMARTGLKMVDYHFLSGLDCDPFTMYNGHIGNIFRTKYRETDYPLTREGLNALFSLGIRAIVHGHQNDFMGQRMMVREGILNIEGDCAVDCNTRIANSVFTPGYAVTVIEPSGRVLGYSADHNETKVFDLSL